MSLFKSKILGIFNISALLLIFSAVIATTITSSNMWNTSASDGDVITASAWNELVRVAKGGSVGGGGDCSFEGEFGCAVGGSSDNVNAWSCKYGWTNGTCNPKPVEDYIDVLSIVQSENSIAGVVYVDIVNGSDLNGDGTALNPYKTLGVGLNSVNNNYILKLAPGTYNESALVFPGKSIHVIGERENTEIIVDGTTTTSGGTETVKFYSLIYSINGRFFNSSGISVEMYNCVLRTATIDNVSPYLLYSTTGTSKIVNSLIYSRQNFDGAAGQIIILNQTLKLQNTYYRDYDNGTTRYSPKNYTVENSIIRDIFVNTATTLGQGSYGAASIKSDYNLDLIESEWVNKGTGSDPDGSTADIGVYGGKYAWGMWAY